MSRKRPYNNSRRLVPGFAAVLRTLGSIVLPLGFAGLAAACTHADIAESPVLRTETTGEPVPVRFSMSRYYAQISGPEASTRAQAGDEVLPEGSIVRVAAYKSGSTASADYFGQSAYRIESDGDRFLLVPCTLDADGEFAGPGEEIKLVPGEQYDVYTYTPAKNEVNHQSSDPFVEFTDGEDFMASKTTVTMDASLQVGLEILHHKCAMMVFEFASDPDDPGLTSLSGVELRLKNFADREGGIGGRYLLNTEAITPPPHHHHHHHSRQRRTEWTAIMSTDHSNRPAPQRLQHP